MYDRPELLFVDSRCNARIPHALRWREQYRYGMAIRVECHAGYRDDQEPLAFWSAGSPTQRWFKVDVDDGNMYVLQYEATSGDREIAAYRGATG